MALTQVSTNGIADGAVTANDLENSGVTAGTYGSSSAIPAITVDAKGRVTSASTSSIDSTAITNGTSNVSVANNGNITITRGGATSVIFGDGNINIEDNTQLRFGDGYDLRIYHDGSQSFIHDAGTGSLVIKADEFFIQNAAGTENKGYFQSDGPVRLYYDTVQKFTTTSTGIDVSGTVTCDGLTCDGSITQGTSTSTSTQNLLNFEDSGGSGFVNLNAHGTADFKFLHNRTGSTNTGIPTSSGGIATNYAVPIYFANNATARAYFDTSGHLLPAANNTYDLGATAQRWRNIYTNDLNLSNENGSNDVDGTWGSWTIQEGEDDLFLLNRRNGKKYKFALTEVN